MLSPKKTNSVALPSPTILGRKDRLFQLTHVVHDIAGHSCKLVPLIVRHFKQRPDDVMHTTAGAKTFARPRNDDDFDIAVVRQISHDVLKFAVRFEGERI